MNVMRWRRFRNERGVTTIEYTMLMSFMSLISIIFAMGIMGHYFRNLMAVFAIKLSIYLTGF